MTQLTHVLKTWPEEFAASMFNMKSFEVRQDDRGCGFTIGDHLQLREWNPKHKEYTGRQLMRQVTYILRGPKHGLPEGLVVMAVIPV